MDTMHVTVQATVAFYVLVRRLNQSLREAGRYTLRAISEPSEYIQLDSALREDSKIETVPTSTVFLAWYAWL